MRSSFILLSLAVFLLGTVTCDFNVWSPHALVEKIKSTLPLALANFGHTPYGKSLSGNLALANPIDACTPIEHLPHDHQQTFIIARYAPSECSAVTQALHAERAGAKMLVLVHDQFQVPSEKNPGQMVDVDFATLDIPDDGMGHLVKIPTIVIEKRSGDKLIEHLSEKQNGTITTTAKFNFLNQTQKVKYSLWMSSASKDSITFVKNFHKFHNLLGDRVEFVPKYVVVSCFMCDLEEQHTKAANNCLSAGRYCAPDHGPRGVVDGRQVVHEDLRQTCIMKQDPSAKLFFKYIEKWAENTDCVEFKKGHECSHRVMDEVGIDTEKVKQCVKDSFLGEDHLIADNKILNESIREYRRAGLPYYPALQINNKAYHGSLKPSIYVFEAMCSAFKNPPEICVDYYGDPSDRNSSGYTWIIIVISLILIFFLGCMVVRYKSSLRAEMMRHMESQVSTQVSQYYAMKGEKGEKPAESS